MPKELRRVSFTIPQKVLNELEKVLKDENYSSRSKAVRDALRGFLADYKWRRKITKKQHGFLMLTYDHGIRGLPNELLDIQHEFQELITSMQHFHVTDEKCLEAIMVSGPGKLIRELVERLKSLRGVKQVKITVLE